MSHIQTIKLQLKNLKAVKKACKKLGLDFNENKTSFNYYGSSQSKADHTISLKGESKEVGLKKNGATFDLLWDPGYTSVTNVIGRKAENLQREYAVATATMEAESQGLVVTRYDQQDGSVRLEAA